MLTKFDDDPFEQTYAFCKEHAMVEGAFSERLTRQWFNAAWALCAEHIGFIYPARTITEMVPVNQEYGTIALSYRPSSPVTLKDGYRVVTILPPNAPCITGEGGCPEVCCFCWLHATYTVGEDLGCDGVPPRFVQAVAQLFAYIVENRGDTAMQPYLLYQSGAHAFLAPEVTYVL